MSAMSREHGGHLRASEPALQQQSTLSSGRSDYGSGGSGGRSGFEHMAAVGGGASFGSVGAAYPAPVAAHGGAPSLGAGQPRVALPPSVKLPPSMMSSYHQPRHSQMPIPNSHFVAYPSPQQRPVAIHPPLSSSSASSSAFSHTVPIPVTSGGGEFGASDVIRQLDLAADENERLQQRLKENNLILEEKVQEIQQCLESRERDRQELQARIGHLEGRLREEERQREAVEKAQREESAQRKSMPATVSDITADETTNKLFEAQVAVMGFKCRVMQLQGELDDRVKAAWDSGAREEIEQLRAEKEALREDLVAAKREKEAAVSRLQSLPHSAPTSGTARVERELKLRIQELGNQVLSQELVIKEVNQQLTDKRHLFDSESQRMHHQRLQHEAQIKSLQDEQTRLQQELGRVQNLMASQQQSYELRLTSLTTQTNMARQEQARAQELGKQLTVAHAEISKLNRDLSEAQKDAEKYKKKSEISETKVKDSTTKMMSMQEQLKGQKMTGPVPKPRGEIAQLKTERERIETQLATVQSNLDRERRAREGAETELQAERRKMQELLMKINQLQSQLGTGGEVGGGGGGGGREREGELRQVQLEVERLRREKSQHETSMTELEREKKEAVDAKIEAEANLAMANEELTTLKSSRPQTGKGKAKSVEVRLNEYAGKLSTLEGLFDNEKAEKNKLQSSLTQEKRRVGELEQQLQELAREKSHVENETVRSLQQQKSEAERALREKELEMVDRAMRHQEDLDRIRAETAAQKQNYERKIGEKEAAMREKERELDTAQQGQSEREGEVQQLKQTLQKAHTDLQSRETEIAQIQSELHSHMTHLHTLHADTETLRANETQITSRLRDVMQENDRLRNELTTTQKVTGEFRKECESLVNDYQGAAKKIEVLEAERDKFRNQAQMGMRELAQRSERVKALEAERQVLQEQLQHMDMQLKQYMADFRSEREMRESAFQVKEMAERKQHELSSEVSTLQRQLTELQTAKHMDSGVGDDPGAAGGAGKVWSGSARHPMSSPRPAVHTTEAGNLHAPPLPPKPTAGGGRGEFFQRQPPMQQQYVGPGGGGSHAGVTVGPFHQRQELVTSAAGPFSQVRPPISQPPVAMVPGTAPQQQHHAAGLPQYPPRSRIDPVPIDPTRVGVAAPPNPQFSQGSPGVVGTQGRQALPGPVTSPPQPPRTSSGWVAPGDIVNSNPPEVACPLCGRNDFATVTDLEIHCARCVGPF